MSHGGGEFRERAEQRLRAEGRVELPREADLAKLVEELRIHQIELEMQNEELRRTTEAAEAARRQYAELFQSAPVGYVILDAQGQIVQANQTFLDLLGTELDCAGKPFDSFLDDVDQAIFLARYRAIFKRPQGKQLEVRLRRPVGTAPVYVRIDAALQPSRGVGSSEPRLLLALGDVSAQRRAEEAQEKLRVQFLQAQKMEAVGQLAGGIAHDFNNILAAMMMELDLLRDEPDMPKEEQAQGIEDLLTSARRAAALTRQLLLFSRRQAMKKAHTDLNVLVSGLSKLLHRLLGETIALSVAPHAEPLWVDCDVAMIEQVLMNLCVNARDAMPRGGPLTVVLRARQFDDPPRVGVGAGPFACLEVSDRGTGMDSGTLEHLFEPFFTTKGPGKGTGLGLPSVHGIVSQHHGWVEVTSDKGQGSTFSVYLPLSSAGTVPVQVPRLAAPRGGGERVLVVEDEPAVRRMVVRCLAQSGYEVVEAISGADALERWETVGPRVSLLFTDMVMPGGISGLDLARTLRGRNPQLRVVIASGYSGAVVEPLPPEFAFLTKPFDVPTLRAVVRERLDQPP